MGKTRTGANRTIVAKWLRDQLPKKCYNCGAIKDLQYHHIVPVIYGGNDVPSNIAVLCGNCHSNVHFGKGTTINHSDCVRRGQAAAKARGVKIGRKPRQNIGDALRTIAERSTQFNEEPKYTEHEVMDALGIKEVCYYKYKKMLKEAMSAEVWPYDWPKPVEVRKKPLYDHVVKDMRGYV